MPLPILQANRDPTGDDLIRYFHRTETLWMQHLADETALESGTAYTNPELNEVHDANHVRDVTLPEGTTPADAIAEAERHFAAQGVRCAYWVMNPSTPGAQNQPLIDELLRRGYTVQTDDILLLGKTPSGIVRDVPGLKIIPARASFKHARALFEESTANVGTRQMAEAHMRHLDDPHWDSLLALKDGHPVAHVGVLAAGDVGRIEEVYVGKTFRRQGIGLLMMGRALEICARSLFKHVFLNVDPGNVAAQALYAKLGFRRLGSSTRFRAPTE